MTQSKLRELRKKRVATLVRVELLGPGMGRVELEGEGIGAGVEPGNFAMVEAPGRDDCILLRPYSYFLAPSDHRIELLIKDVGAGTHGLLGARPGQAVGVFGPLGSSFPPATDATWAIAGGVGAAPFGVCTVAAGGGLRVLFGARTVNETGFARALQAAGAGVTLATDDGSAGYSGSVVALLSNRLAAGERPDRLYTCGPTPMMAAVAAVARGHGIACWTSLEARMGCGIGVCRGCAHQDATGGWRCICVDGPVYDSKTIFADSLAAGPSNDLDGGAP